MFDLTFFFIFLMFYVLLIFGPTAPHVCEHIGGPFSGGSGAPPVGHHGSAACTCPAEEVCHINGLKRVSWRCLSPEVHIRGNDLLPYCVNSHI